MDYSHSKHPLNKQWKIRCKWVITHTAFIMIGIDFVAYMFEPSLGRILEPMHETLVRGGGTLAMMVVYLDG